MFFLLLLGAPRQPDFSFFVCSWAWHVLAVARLHVPRCCAPLGARSKSDVNVTQLDVAAGATGFGVQLLVDYLQQVSKAAPAAAAQAGGAGAAGK